MADRKKILDALDHCAIKDDCRGCAYKPSCWGKGETDFGHMIMPLMLDTIELLKEDELLLREYREKELRS